MLLSELSFNNKNIDFSFSHLGSASPIKPPENVSFPIHQDVFGSENSLFKIGNWQDWPC